MQKDRKKRTKIVWAVLAAVLFANVAVWLLLRSLAQVPSYENLSLPDPDYTESEKVIHAVSLSYFIYGCEGSDAFAGTVSDMLDSESRNMGILIENFGIVRRESRDPATAVFDTSDFIRRQTGEFRCLCCQKDGKNGFCGAAFCDDDHRCVWVVYAGAISWPDYRACAGLVTSPGFTAQEKAAFSLFQTVLECDEVKNQSYGIFLTGHSLGGALATEVSLASGCPAVTINGADNLAYDKIARISGKKSQPCQVHNYVTLPDGISFMETIQRLMFLGSGNGVTTHLFEKNGYTTDSHCAFSFLRFADDHLTKPVLPDEVPSETK